MGATRLLLLCAAVALFAGGCVSARTTTNLKPSSDSNLKSPAGMFYVANVKYANPAATQGPAQAMAERTERSLLPLVRQECAARYPALFASDPASAIPLGVEISSASEMHNAQTMGWMFGTLLISGLILPVPGQTDENCTVNVGVWNGAAGPKSQGAQTQFRRESHTWVTLLTPVALIHVPGESDFPKISGSLLSTAELEDCYSQQVASQTATALAQLVAAKEAAFWTQQPVQPLLPGASSPLPAALPPPTDSASPF